MAFLEGAFGGFTPLKFKEELGSRIYKFLVSYLLQVPAEQKNLVIAVRDRLTGYAFKQEDIAQLVGWFKGENEQLKGVEIGLMNQWKIVALAHKSKQYTREEKQQLFNTQAERDPSDTSKNFEQKCN